MAILENTKNFVKKQLENAESGHDWFHIARVYKNALLIAKEETCNLEVIQLAALLHDIADSKFHDGDESIGPKTARDFLTKEKVSEATISHVVAIIENISFKGGNFEKNFSSKELEIVQTPTDLMQLELLELHEHLITVVLKTEKYIIQKSFRICRFQKKHIKIQLRLQLIIFTKNYCC
jgi:HD superfamily phosphodiesterase